MATADCNDELNYVCEECYRLVYDDCEDIIIDVGLDESTEYCLKFYDKFGTTYQYLATTDSDGAITIDESELPDKFFNPYSGLIELQIFADCDTTTREQFTVAYTQYNCLLLENSESVEDNDTVTEPNSINYVAVEDNGVAINVQCGGTYICSIVDCDDATVQNSDSSYANTIASGDSETLPDITLTQPNGDVETHPSVKNLTCDTEAVVIAGADFNTGANLTALRANTDWENYILTVLNTAEELIAYNNMDIVYNFPPPTGQTTSYATGDDGYQWTNLWSTYWATTRVGKRPQLATFTTLISNNSFGNTNRFTDSVGGATYSDNYMIDHYTGLGWYLTIQSAQTWANAISGAEGFTTLYTDWFIPNTSQLFSVQNMSISTSSMNYSPFNYNVDTELIWTSTTSPKLTTMAYGFYTSLTSLGLTLNFNRQIKTSAAKYFLCRKHF